MGNDFKTFSTALNFRGVLSDRKKIKMGVRKFATS